MKFGLNHNIRYHNQVFHCQTEDLGHTKQSIVTHLFLNGQVIASLQTSYLSTHTPETLLASMKNQHQSIMKQLIRGEFDNAINEPKKGTS